MAHTPETRTTFDGLLKYVYGPIVRQLTPTHSVLLNFLKTKSGTKSFSGKSVNLGVLYNSHGSAMSVDETDPLPVSLPTNHDLTTIPLSYHYFAANVTGQAIAVSDDRIGALAAAWATIIKVRQRAFAQDVNRKLCGDGNAILCQVDGFTGSGQAITVDNAMGISGQRDSDVNGAKFLSKNMYIQSRDSGGTVEDAGLLITSISTAAAWPSTSAVITVTGTATSVDDGSYFYKSGSATASTDAYGHEMNGIDSLIDDAAGATTSIQSIDCATNGEWASQVVRGATPGTAEALTTARLMQMYNMLTVNAQSMPDLHVVSPAVFLEYGNMADANNQVMNQATYDTGWPALDFMGKPVYQEPYCLDKWYAINTDALAMYETGPADFMSDDKGAVITQRKGASAAYDDYEAYYNWYMLLAIEERAKCGKLVDITVNNNFLLQ